jgi:hypothetical protein
MGIDYGAGKTNLDVKTGIRYGVISMHDVMQAWCDSSEPYYPCEDCDIKSEQGDDQDPICDGCEPSSWFLDDGDYQAESCFDGTEIMIYKSPYFTAGKYCSPCAPGAINLNDACKETPLESFDNISYCFGHDWFDAEKAPYRVWEVKTGKEVFAWRVMTQEKGNSVLIPGIMVQAKDEIEALTTAKQVYINTDYQTVARVEKL